MQNEDNPAHASVLPAGVLETFRKTFAEPRAVLFTVGLIGFLIDLWEPISVVGLALLVLATTPWIVQAFQPSPSVPIKAVEVGRQKGLADLQVIGRKFAGELREKSNALPLQARHDELAPTTADASVVRPAVKSALVQQADGPASTATARKATVPTALRDLDRPQPRRLPQTPATTSGAP